VLLLLRKDSVMSRDKEQEAYEKAKAASEKAAEAHRKAQEELRDKQNVNNPPRLTRKERKLTKQMAEEPNPPKKKRL